MSLHNVRCLSTCCLDCGVSRAKARVVAVERVDAAWPNRRECERVLMDLDVDQMNRWKYAKCSPRAEERLARRARQRLGYAELDDQCVATSAEYRVAALTKR